MKKGLVVSDFPELLLEWDYELNNSIQTPDSITIGNSTIKVNWKCSSCGHRWPSTVYNRAHLKSGCPQCANQRISNKSRERLFDSRKSLVTLFPDIAAEWHPTKNLPREVSEIMPGSNDQAWWLCSVCGTEFLTQVCNRTGNKHVGCPTCNKHMHTSFPEQAIFYYVKQSFPNAQNGYTDGFENQMELDIFIPERMTGIEYDGNFWHSNKVIERNKRKYEMCQKNGINLVRIKEDYKRYKICRDDCDIVISRDDATDYGLNNAIISMLRLLDSDTTCDIDVARDRSVIKSNYITSFRATSLQARFPNIASEWHPTLNGMLRPDMVMPASHDKVWWLRPKCGSPYSASPSKRTRKNPSACPVCTGKKIVVGINDLATFCPDLAKEWHPTLNGDLLPTMVAPNYSKKVWWMCANCGNEFHVTPNKRVSRNQGCDKCAMKRRSEEQHKKSLKNGKNTVAALRPDLLEEWDYERNNDFCTPENVSTGNTSILIHWICSKCGNRWQASAYSRVRLGSGCKACSYKRVGQLNRSRAVKRGMNDMASQYPELLKEWDYEKNKSICSPDGITIGSNTRVHWSCPTCGYKWCTSPYNRIHNRSGCRMCSGKKRKE